MVLSSLQHIQRGVTLESAEHVLLGLPNLVEFKHPLMVLALEKIILGSRADRVSAIRNLYIRGRNLDEYLLSGIRTFVGVTPEYLVRRMFISQHKW